MMFLCQTYSQTSAGRPHNRKSEVQYVPSNISRPTTQPKLRSTICIIKHQQAVHTTESQKFNTYPQTSAGRPHSRNSEVQYVSSNISRSHSRMSEVRYVASNISRPTTQAKLRSTTHKIKHKQADHTAESRKYNAYPQTSAARPHSRNSEVQCIPSNISRPTTQPKVRSIIIRTLKHQQADHTAESQKHKAGKLHLHLKNKKNPTTIRFHGILETFWYSVVFKKIKPVHAFILSHYWNFSANVCYTFDFQW